MSAWHLAPRGVTSVVEPAQQLRTFYQDHHGWLQGWLRRKLGNAFDAADLAQDVFMKMLARREDCVEVREPRAYLSTIARGLVVEHWRRRELEQAWLETVAQLPEPESPSPESRLVFLETLIAIDAMLDSLKPKVRNAFLWAQLEGVIEGTLNWRASAQWSLGGTLAWLEGLRETESGNSRRISSRDAPPLMIGAYAEYAPTSHWRNRLQLDYHAQRDPFGDSVEYGEGRVDSLFLAHLSSTLDVGPGELALGIRNLFNHRYFATAVQSDNTGYYWIPEQGRRVGLSYSMSW